MDRFDGDFLNAINTVRQVQWRQMPKTTKLIPLRCDLDFSGFAIQILDVNFDFHVDLQEPLPPNRKPR
jgi:hypothetical protein